MKWDSTLLAQKADIQEIQKADLDLLKKINELSDVTDTLAIIPTPVMCSVYQNGGTAFGSIGWNPVTFNSVEFDTNACWSTENNIYTAKVAGYYVISMQLVSNNRIWAMGDIFLTGIYKNGSNYCNGTLNSTPVINPAGSQTSSLNRLVYLAVNDTIKPYCYGGPGAGMGTSGTIIYCFMSIRQVD